MTNSPSRPDYRRKRPAPRTATGWGKNVSDTVIWDRVVEHTERYRITYIDRDNQRSERIIELKKLGHVGDTPYIGVMEGGRFKTMRSDRVVGVEKLSTGHEPSIHAQPTYGDVLPAFPLPNAVYRIPTTAVSNRSWTIDLNSYTCTCPEKRIRAAANYKPGQLGAVCDHIAKAITQNWPSDSSTWTPALHRFLSNPRNVHIDNLV